MGECNKNSWMLENCRQSCNSCLNEYELRQMCRNTNINDELSQFNNKNISSFKLGLKLIRVIRALNST